MAGLFVMAEIKVDGAEFSKLGISTTSGGTTPITFHYDVPADAYVEQTPGGGWALKTGARHSKADNDVLKRMRQRNKEEAADLDEVGAPPLDPDPEPQAEQTEADCIAPGQIVKSKDEADTLVHSGGAVKALGDGKLGGYLVVFGDPNHTDLEGDFFTDQTDFGDATDTAVYYHHGLDKAVGPRVIGKAQLKRDPIGIWMEAQLNMRDAYERAVYQMGEAGKLGLSSGTAAHLVVRERVTNKSAWIKQWPLGLDGSFTPTPAEPRTFAVPLKSLKTTSDLSVDADSQSGGSTASDDAQTESAPAVPDQLPVTQEIKNMDENELKALLDKRDADKAEAARIAAEAETAKQNEIKAAVEAERAKIEAEYKTSRKGGYAGAPSIKRVTNLGFSGDDMDTFRHWVKTGDNVAAKAAMQEDTDSEGGYLVPDGFYARISEKLREKSVVRAAGATIVQTGLKMTEFPVENASSATAIVAEEGAASESEPTLSVVQITNYKATQLVKVSEELLNDAQSNLDMFLENQIINNLAAWENNYFLNGTGTSQPAGALAGATLGVTCAGAAAITPAELVSLIYTIGDRYADNGKLIMRRATLGYIRGLTSANQFLFNNTPQGSGSGNGDGGIGSDEVLYNMPVFQTAQMPAMAATAKTILLGDFSQYVITERQGLTVTRNPWLYQANGQVGIFATKRQGGAPLLAEAFYYLRQA